MRFAKLVPGALLTLAAAAFGAGTFTDRSGTITTGGTSQQLVGINGARKAIVITHATTETEPLCVNATSAASCSAGSSFTIAPGGSLCLETVEAINVVAATTGHKFVAKEGESCAVLMNGGSATITGGGDATAANQVTLNTSIGATNESAASSDTATSGLNGLIKRLLQQVTVWLASIGATNESAAGSDTATSGLNGLLKRIAQNITALTAAVNSDASTTGTVGSTAPTKATLVGAKTGASIAAVTQGDATVKIDTASAATAELVALTSGQRIRITSLSVIAGGTGTIKLVYGTGTNCGTGTTDLTGAYPLVANVGLTLGSGLGPVIAVPASQALCITTSAAVQYSGHITYAKYAD